MSDRNDINNNNLPNITNFARQVLTAHNTYRFRHGVRPLRLDEKLMEQSHESALKLLQDNGDEDEGCLSFPELGENVYIFNAGDPRSCNPNGKAIVDEWYSQRFLFDVVRQPENRGSLNYSQIVWKDSEFLGVGLGRSPEKVVVTCFYQPAGNISGFYRQNVFPEMNPVHMQCNGY